MPLSVSLAIVSNLLGLALRIWAFSSARRPNAQRLLKSRLHLLRRNNWTDIGRPECQTWLDAVSYTHLTLPTTPYV